MPRRACTLALLALALTPAAVLAQDTWTLSGVVRTRVRGMPATDATVRVLELGRAERTDETGAFRFDAIPEGSWSLEASAPNGGEAEVAVTLSGGPLSGVMLELSPPASLSGRVATPGLTSPDRIGTQIALSPGGITTTTDSDGDYHIPTLPIGWYDVRISREGYRDARPRVYADGPTRLDVALTPDVSHRLRLELVAMDAPISEAALWIDGEPHGSLTTSAPVELALPQGRHDIALETRDHQPLALIFTLERDTAFTLAPVSEAPPEITRSVGCAVSASGHGPGTHTVLLLICAALVLRGSQGALRASSTRRRRRGRGPWRA